MQILNEEKKKEKKVRFKCSCGCILEAGVSEVIPIPRHGQYDEFVGTDYYVRCPKCNDVVHTFE